MQRWNDFLADVQDLRFQADEHARHHRLPRLLVNHPPTPVLQLIRARQDNRRLDAVAIYAAGGDVILQHIEMAIVGVLLVAQIFK